MVYIIRQPILRVVGFVRKKKLTLKYRTEPGLLPQQTIQLPQLQAHLNYSSLIDESHFSI